MEEFPDIEDDQGNLNNEEEQRQPRSCQHAEPIRGNNTRKRRGAIFSAYGIDLNILNNVACILNKDSKIQLMPKLPQFNTTSSCNNLD